MYNEEPTETFIYVMESKSQSRFKIGRSINPTERIKTLRRYVPDLQIVNIVKAHKVWETDLDAKFARSRIDGEWFRLCPADLELIAELFQKKRDFDVRRAH